MNASNYHPDQPITHAKEDLYNRVGFAKEIVQMFSSLEHDENYIVGIYAEWGFGKTSVINLINELLDHNKFIVINVDAWSLGGAQDKILWQILKETYEKITGQALEKKITKLGKRLRNISKAQSPFDLEVELDLNGGGRKETKVSSGKILNSMNFIGSLLESSNNISAAKRKVNEVIRASKRKIIIFIDNIDRLDKTHIVEVFRLLSTIANYVGTTYVLPFDKEFICSAVEDSLPQGQSGADYIEKIIQIPIHLPVIPRTALDNAFTVRLTHLLGDCSITLSREEIERFQLLYYQYNINEYIRSPRNINQIINALRFVLPVKYGEMNMVDLIILEIIRVFNEQLYKKIRDNGDMLLESKTSLSSDYMFDDEHQKRKSDIEKVFGDEHNPDLKIIRQLFPFTNSVFNHTTAETYDSLRRAQRLGSENYFERFFSAMDEVNSISDQKLLRLLNDSADKQTIDKNLTIVNAQNINVALRSILDRCDLIKNKIDFCKSLLDLAEEENLLQHRSMPLMMGAFNLLLFTIDAILEKSSNKLAAYSALLEYNFKKHRISTIPYLIRQVVLYSDPSHTRKEIILDKEDLERYKRVALRIIREIAKNNEIPLDTTGDDALIYSYWAEFGTKDEISKYIKKHVKTADSAIDFLSQFLGKWSSVGKNDYRRGDFNEAVYQKICAYIEPEYFYRLIINNKKYSCYKGIKKEAIISFEDHWDKDNMILAEVGQEHTAAFRVVVAQRFISIFEDTLQEGELVEGIK